MISRILEQPRVGVWAGMGMGKSCAALTAVSLLQLVDPSPVLVLAPLRVARSTWPNEAKKWDHLNHLKVVPITGSASQRTHALFGQKADVFTMNFENLPWLLEALASAGRGWPFKTVIADESTKLKSFRLGQGGKRARALGKIAFSKIERFVELTGTPSPNGLVDLWGQAWFLDRGERLGRTFGAFRERWFTSIPTDSGYTIVKPRAFADEQIQAALSDICFSLDPHDYFDLHDPIVTDVKVQLPTAARDIYTRLEREMVAEIEGHVLEASTAAALTIKCLQLTSGAIYTDDKGSWQMVHDEKLDALESIVEEAAGMPVLVAYHFKSDLARLQRKFRHARVLDKDPRTIDAWNAGKIPMLLAHPASAGHGLNLQDGGNILVFFSNWWDLEQYMQIIERIGPTRQAQAGHDRPVYIYHLVAEGTIEELVIARRHSKRSVQDMLMEAVKHEAA
jgi:SNF2 family DNA or RNA helicase